MAGQNFKFTRQISNDGPLFAGLGDWNSNENSTVVTNVVQRFWGLKSVQYPIFQPHFGLSSWTSQTLLLPCCFNSIFKGCSSHDSIFWLFLRRLSQDLKAQDLDFQNFVLLKVFFGKQKCTFLEWTCLYYIEDITCWRKDMNFIIYTPCSNFIMNCCS